MKPMWPCNHSQANWRKKKEKKKPLRQRSWVWEKTLLQNPWKAKNIINGKLLFWSSWEELQTKDMVTLKGSAETISVQLINYAFKRIWEDRTIILSLPCPTFFFFSTGCYMNWIIIFIILILINSRCFILLTPPQFANKKYFFEQHFFI